MECGRGRGGAKKIKSLKYMESCETANGKLQRTWEKIPRQTPKTKEPSGAAQNDDGIGSALFSIVISDRISLVQN